MGPEPTALPAGRVRRCSGSPENYPAGTQVTNRLARFVEPGRAGGVGEAVEAGARHVLLLGCGVEDNAILAPAADRVQDAAPAPADVVRGTDADAPQRRVEQVDAAEEGAHQVVDLDGRRRRL